ncbi:MAG TPA: aldehyde dehydrogenase [Flavobacteriales bacterium]|nr:aldehyde dehydrogenase [Flavobacteriales bacterium]HQV74131.1 aldehyde dehydrogenase [Flavobacteriales bacterium]
MEQFDKAKTIEVLKAQRSYFKSGATRSYGFRKKALKDLRESIKKHEQELLDALHKDLHKPAFEAFISDIGTIYQELDHALSHLKDWMRPEQVGTPISLQVASSEIRHDPLGVVLIIAPWNYPFQLVIEPLIGAVAAGNCALLKPSKAAPHTAAVTKKIIFEVFAPAHVSVVEGDGSAVVPALVEAFRFDHIFFTGSTSVGKKIAALAATDLISVTLELGGKSPAIIDKEVDLKVATKRIAWGKFFNAGQTCIAPDHVLIHEDRKEEFLSILKKTLFDFYGEEVQRSTHFGRIINNKQFEKLKDFLGQGKTSIGGQHAAEERYIAPTVLTDITHNDSVMQEEIFGPILPVLTWRTKEELLDLVGRNPFPLSTYIFSSNKANIAYFTERIAFGGGCINHCLLHFGNSELPFGGIGYSGLGKYHGKHGFDTFSHSKPLMEASTLIDHGLQFPPYSMLKDRVLRWVLR